MLRRIARQSVGLAPYRSGFDHKGHRTVVHEPDIHVRLEHTGGYGNARCARTIDKVVIEFPCFLRWSRTIKRRPPALTAIAEKRELRYHKQRSAYVEQAEVHLAGIIWKDAELDHFVQHGIGILCRIASLNAKKEEEPAANLPGNL